MQSNAIPPNWKRYTLGDIYTERKEPGNDSLPVLSVSIHSGVSDGELDEEELGKKIKRIQDKSQYRKAIKGDLVFNMMRAWQGAIGVVRTDGQVSPAYIVARPNEKVYPPFMDYYMKTPRMIHAIHRQSYGVTDFRLRLYWDSFAPIPCVIPPLEEQKKIAEILATQDRVIALYDQKIVQLRLLKKYCLQKMFPRRGSNVPEIRFPGFADPWEQRKLGEVAASFEYGLNAAAKEFDGVNKYLRITDIDDVSHEFRDDDLTSPDTDLSAASNYQLHNGEILFARTGASVGKSFIYRESDGLVYFAGFLIRARIKPEYDAEFVFQNTLGLPYEKYIQVTSQRSGQPGVNAQEYAEYSLMVPSYAEQKRIGGFLHQIDTLITLHLRKREEEQKRKKLLMQLLLKGNVRINHL